MTDQEHDTLSEALRHLDIDEGRVEWTRDRINDLASDIQTFPPGQPLDAATWEDWWTRLLRIAQEA